MKSEQDVNDEIVEVTDTAQPVWTTPRFEVLDVACETRSGAGPPADADQFS